MMRSGRSDGRMATPLPIPDTLHVDTTGHVDLDAVADWCRHPR